MARGGRDPGLGEAAHAGDVDLVLDCVEAGVGGVVLVLRPVCTDEQRRPSGDAGDLADHTHGVVAGRGIGGDPDLEVGEPLQSVAPLPAPPPSMKAFTVSLGPYPVPDASTTCVGEATVGDRVMDAFGAASAVVG